MHHTACFYRHLNLRNSLTIFNHPIDINEHLTTELNQKNLIFIETPQWG